MASGRARSATLALLLVALAGCGGGPFDLVPVSGTVRYDDGGRIPAGNYELKFVPQVESPDGVQFPRVGTAIVDSEGAFSAATTHKYQDGLIVGKQKVYFKIGRGPDSQPLVPEAFLSSETTPLEVEVDRRARLTIEVPRPAS